MSGDTETHTGGDGALKGWDKGAFWYPTLDKRGALLAVFLLLLVLHFDEIFGLASSQTLVFGWWPITMAYHVGINVLHVAFMVLIYLNWPDPKDEDVDRPGVRAADEAAAVGAAAEGD
jgi:hypothetical protein